ncbi:hypothetical protein [Actinopolymorpha singaporensis]|uniref:Uncharacterized protein n=1 Tax=Actinopolymorpha singaporensis TaxID=117157 RepID=A0A1H1XDG3_9ACTN|nr:hypothetical protein [Actinopolymorpha singaporensis]SDT06726.1 hypothetical protein SAMN04489717_4908 [Actinopolymorpha singaporensis]
MRSPSAGPVRPNRPNRPVRTAAVLAALAVLTLSTSCGAGTTVEAGDRPDSPTATKSAAPTPSATESARPTPSATSSPGSTRRPGGEGGKGGKGGKGGDRPGMPPATPPGENWQPLIRVDAVDGTPAVRTLKVHYALPTPCSPGLRRAEVTERPDAVVIKLHRDPPGRSDVICAQVIKEQSVEVHLDTPVGARPLVDGSSGRVVKLRG